MNNDVAEAMNLSALEGLEERFSHQVKILPVLFCDPGMESEIQTFEIKFYSGCNKC